MRYRASILVLAMTGVLCNVAEGTSYTYTYTGHSFQVSGSPTWTGIVTLTLSDASPLSSGTFQTLLSPPFWPHSWTMSDGKNSLSSTDPGATFAGSLTTDSSGNVVSWDLGAYNTTGLTISTVSMPYVGSSDGTSKRATDGTLTFSGANNASPGKWSTGGNSTPPPSSLNRAGALAHIAFGGGWSTEITLVNTSTGPVSITLNFHGDDGKALTLPITATQQGSIQTITSSTVSATLNANTTWLVSVGATPFYYQTNTVVGWVDVLSSGRVGGYAIFRSSPQTGSPSEGTAILQSQYPTTVTLPFDNTAGFAMGMALANMSASPVTITASIWDDNGAQLGSQVFSMSTNGHTSFTLPDQFPVTVGKRGIIRFQSSSSSGLSGLGLRFSPFYTFTSVPTL